LLENRQKDTIEYKEALAQSYSYLAHLELLENRIEKSLSYYQKSLSINRDFQTDIRYSTLLIAQNSFLKAFRNFELMLKRYKGLEQQAKILMEYGNFYTTINQNIAKEKLLDSLKLYKKLSMINNKIYKEIDIISKELGVNIQTQKRT
jgi:tetratricopeptide (TPR) repeat protein